VLSVLRRMACIECVLDIECVLYVEFESRRVPLLPDSRTLVVHDTLVRTSGMPMIIGLIYMYIRSFHVY
jgi:hypothetical protein